jgi:hypothetical protein
MEAPRNVCLGTEEDAHREHFSSTDGVGVPYVYKVDDTTLSGMESIPFLWGSSAEDYVRRNPPESSLTVRVKPSEPEISIMRDEDQDRTQASDEHHALHGVC